jgi:hypothetical protein
MGSSQSPIGVVVGTACRFGFGFAVVVVGMKIGNGVRLKGVVVGRVVLGGGILVDGVDVAVGVTVGLGFALVLNMG